MQIFASNEKSCERKNMEPHSVPAIISLKTFRAEGENFQQSAQRRGKGGGGIHRANCFSLAVCGGISLLHGAPKVMNCLEFVCFY